MDNENVQKKQNDLDDLLSDKVSTTREELDNSIVINDDYILIPSGNALTIKETYNITASYDTKIIILVGPVASGKTTIETTIYQLFQNGQIGDHYFAGSETLHAYEQRSFNSRVVSNGSIPTMQRTARNTEEIFLHLKLWNFKKKKMINYLFADLSGEIISENVGKVEMIKKHFPFVKHADYIVSILNGELILDKNKRLGMIENAKSLLQTIYSAKLFNENTKFQIVFSKFDLIKKEENIELSEFIVKQAETINQIFNQKFGSIQYFNIAAMPSDISVCDIGYGIKELLNSWDYPKEYLTKYISKIDVSSEINKLRRKLGGDQL